MQFQEHYAEWRNIRLNDRVVWRFNEFIQAAMNGYKTVKGYHEFVEQVGQFFWNMLDEPVNPHRWDKLLRTAQRHQCNKELRNLRATFENEWLQHRRYANESIDEFEFNQRGKM